MIETPRQIVFVGGPLDGTTMSTDDRTILIAEKPSLPLLSNRTPQVVVAQRVGRYCTLDEDDSEGREIYDWKGWE